MKSIRNQRIVSKPDTRRQFTDNGFDADMNGFSDENTCNAFPEDSEALFGLKTN